MCKKNGKLNIALFAAAVLLCLTLFTTHLTSGLYARYMTEASGSDSARVAKWDVQMESTQTAMNFEGSTYGQDSEILVYGFSVSNYSEVSMSYSVRIDFKKALPANTKLCMDDKEWISCDGSTKIFSFGSYYSGEGSQKNSHSLKIQIDYVTGDTTHSFDEFTDIPVTVTVEAEQID